MGVWQLEYLYANIYKENKIILLSNHLPYSPNNLHLGLKTKMWKSFIKMDSKIYRRISL